MKRALALCTACLSLAAACARGGDPEIAESIDPVSSGPGADADSGTGGDPPAPDPCPDADHDGHRACADAALPDCDDANAKIYPGAAEVCDGQDNDCDGQTDEIPAVLGGSLAAPADPHWKVAGSAVLSPDTWVTLTPDATSIAGALWWDAPSADGGGAYTFDAFEATFTFVIQPKQDGADGLAFAWVPGGDLTRVGQGPFYGAGDLGGYAVGIDTFQNPGEPAAPFLAILGPTNNTQLGRYTIPDVRDGAEHTLRVRLSDGAISVWMTTAGVETNYVSNFEIPGYVPFRGRWGVTGGTGALSETHWARDVSMTFPRGQGCAP